MQKNLYFRHVLRRRNAIGEALTNFFLSLSSYPRLLLEVFIRKNFGDRYFSVATVVCTILVLVFGPWMLADAFSTAFHGTPTLGYLITENKSWYLFTLAFTVFSVIRYREIKSSPSVFDFGRYSLSSGDIHPLFRKLKWFGKKPSVRLIETVYEPAFFLVIGFVLAKMEIKVGYFIMLCSAIYSLGYIGAYQRGDDFIKDKIDEMICNQEMENVFVNDEDTNTRGVRFRAEKPASRQLRKELAEEFVVEERETAEAL